MQKILVSRCLLGEHVRYDGQSHGPFRLLKQWQNQGRVVALCPEMAGGLPVPRAPAEIPGGQGGQVLDGVQKVWTIDQQDVTDEFVTGARLALALVRGYRIKMAVLKAGSPSCGNRENYDGTFSGRKVAGEGVTAAILRRAGLAVFNERQLDEALHFLQKLECSPGRQ